MKKNQKSLVLIGDLHCGNEAGLSSAPKNVIQVKLLQLYKETIKSLGEPPNILVVNGDAIDGLQKKLASRDITEGLREQRLDACNLIEMWRAKEVFVIEGTGYHVGEDGQEEGIVDLLVKAGVKASYHRKLNLIINDWFKLQCRHFIGSGSLPHTRATSPSRAKLWETMNAGLTGKKIANLSVYAHVHYYQCLEDAFGTVITLPAWQAVGSAFGDLKCDGHIDIGAVKIIVGATQEEGWQKERRLYPANLSSRTVRR